MSKFNGSKGRKQLMSGTVVLGEEEKKNKVINKMMTKKE